MGIDRRTFLGGAISVPFVKAPPTEDLWPIKEYSVPTAVESNWFANCIVDNTMSRITNGLVNNRRRSIALLERFSASDQPTEQQLEFEF